MLYGFKTGFFSNFMQPILFNISMDVNENRRELY